MDHPACSFIPCLVPFLLYLFYYLFKDLIKLYHRQKIRNLTTRGDAQGLIESLRKNYDAGETADALRGIGSAAVEPLIVALEDTDENVRWSVIYLLGQISDVRAVEPLIASLEDKDRGGRQAIAEALAQIGDARAVEPLIASLKDWDGRQAVAEALGQIGDDRAVEPLIASLENETSALTREIIIKALGRIGDARAVAPLIASLEDEDEGVQVNAAEALAQIGDARAVEPLSDRLQYYNLGDYAKASITKALKKLEAIPEAKKVIKRLQARQQAEEAKLPDRRNRSGKCSDCGRSIPLTQATMRRLWNWNNEAYQYHCPNCYKANSTYHHADLVGELLNRDGKHIIDQIVGEEWHLGS